MNPLSACAIGIDIGGTTTKLGLVNAQGIISNFQTLPTRAHSDPQPFLATLVESVTSLIESSSGNNILGIGYSLHGFIDADRTGPIVCPNTPSLRGLNLRHLMEERFGLPVVVNSDLTAHVLAEYHFGTGQGVNRFLCLAIGTGLGAGVVINGDALRFSGGCAGDNGHIIIQPGGPTCSMGCQGCAEALCGTAGIERLARQQFKKKRPAYDIIASARDGDPDGVAIMEQIGAWLGVTLASLCSIFLPVRVALTGGTSEAGEVLRNACENRFRELVGEYHHNTVQMAAEFYGGVEIVLGKLRGQTGVAGAVTELFFG